MYRWQRTERALRAAVCGLALAVAAGCASQRAANQADEASRSNNWDAAVYHLLEALAGDPDNISLRMDLLRARQKAGQEHFKRGQALRELGNLTQARDELTLAVQLDPSHQFAEQELAQLEKDLELFEQPGGPQALEELKKKAREAKVKPPLLNPTTKEPITLSFPKPKPVKEIYQAIAKAYGFNVLFDPKLKDDKLSIELSQVTAQQALEIVMQAAGHFYKVIDEHSIIIVDETPQNRREYEDLVIKTFFLSNAEVKDVDKLLRSLIEARRLATNDQLNAITLRDTADKVAIAEKLITVNDKAKAEVVIDVELMLVTGNKTSDLGVALSTLSFNLIAQNDAITGTPPSISIDRVGEIQRGDWFVNVPFVTLKLIESSGLAEVIAQPQLRVTEGEKASLHIGDRVPIPVTSFNTQYSGSTGVIPVTSFQYQDVGIKIEVEPRVHHNREVTLKLTVEVSNLGEEVPVGSGDQKAVTIGTRSITSVIRLRSGESSLLAGLYRRDRTETDTKVPFLSDLPLIGRLFTSRAKLDKTTDLVLALTPHIVRFPDIREEDLAPIWVGTESRVSYFGSSSPRVQSGRVQEGPFDGGEEPPPPDEEEKEQEPEATDLTKPVRPRPRPSPFGVREPVRAPGGVDLVPGAGPKELGDDASEQTSGDSSDDKDSLDAAPLQLSVEPSVISLRQGQETTLQVVATGDTGPLRVPVGLSYDPQRLVLVGAQPATGVTVAAAEEQVDGWLGLELVVSAAAELPRPLLAVTFRALEAGPAPLTLSCDGVTAADGSALRVSAGAGAVLVLAREGGG